MSKVTPEVVSFDSEKLLFDFPESDTILRSCDFYEFSVLNFYIFHSSPILGEHIVASLNSDVGTSLPIVQLPETGSVLFSLLSYIFPVPPILPSTLEQTMQLLSAAQKYNMDVALIHIRNHIALQEPQFIREETAFLVYSLAQKYGLRQEALQAARSTLSFSPLIIEDFSDKHDMMPGAFLHELWKYHDRVRRNLASDLEEFKTSRAPYILNGLQCTASGSPVDNYITSLKKTPALFDLTKFHMSLANPVQGQSRKGHSCTACEDMSSKEIRAFWVALTAVVHDSMTKAESDLLLLGEGTNFEGPDKPSYQSWSPTKYSDMPNADIILLSSDLARFRVHRSVLVASSPLFSDMFSLPQPPENEAVNGLPIVHLPEDAEVLDSLISVLYPVDPVIPDSDEKILCLLSACQKYDMVAIQSRIRAEVSRRGLLSPTGAKAFRLYAIAYRERLVPETEAAARLTLDFPMMFEYLGEALRSFEGSALSDLIHFRQCCKLSLISCFSLLYVAPFNIWVLLGTDSWDLMDLFAHSSNLQASAGDTWRLFGPTSGQKTAPA
ncbi:hypothetical protein B0F90DRAFT_1820632 [Multifurca ochricompacta]|uniref:BTB domain-containing protein n=1 Tax=Multifurca ochricompacta TaxID=376703 RepID=A0AAD4QKU8_9AGAM|nr:hypothetical protein B0F90DRAFT_1820632 [Multifurca ochricompacta]